MYQKPAMH